MGLLARLSHIQIIKLSFSPRKLRDLSKIVKIVEKSGKENGLLNFQFF
jgi:hypothetical protein